MATDLSLVTGYTPPAGNTVDLALTTTSFNYKNGACSLANAQAISATASITNPVKDASVTLDNAHNLSPVAHAGANKDGSVSLSNVQVLSVDGTTGVAKYGSASLSNSQVILATAKSGASKYGTATLGNTQNISAVSQAGGPKYGSTTLDNTQALTPSANSGAPKYGAISLANGHVANVTGQGGAFLDASVSLDNPHTQYSSAVTGKLINARAHLVQPHNLNSSSDGGTSIVPPVDQSITFDITKDPINDIGEPTTGTRLVKSWDTSYYTEGSGGFCRYSGGINTNPVNINPINGCIDVTTVITLELEITQTYKLIEPTWEITQTYEYVTDLTQIDFEVTQEWSLDKSGTNVRYWEITQEYPLIVTVFYIDQNYNLVGNNYLEELLGYVNQHRKDHGIPEIEGLWNGNGPDIAHVHSTNMADTETYAHESVNFPIGWQTVDERFDIVRVNDSLTDGAENIALHGRSPAHAAEGFSEHDPVSAVSLFNVWRFSPPHNTAMLTDWGTDAHPLMGLGYVSRNATDTGPYASGAGIFSYTYITQIFYSFKIPEGSTVSTFEITQEWVSNTPMYTEITQEWGLDAYTPVTTQHKASYNVSLATQHGAIYSYRIATQHIAPIHYNITTQNVAPYTSTVPIVDSHLAKYDMLIDIITQSNLAKYGIHITKVNIANYENSGIVKTQHSANYAMPPPLVTQHTAPYSNLYYISKQHGSVWNINNFNTVVASNRAYYTLVDDTIHTDNPYVKVIVGGVTVPTLASVVSATEGNVLWHSKIVLKDLTHYAKFVEGTQYTVEVQGDVYAMQYSAKSIDRQAPSDVTITVEGLSPAMVLQEPRAENLTKTYDTHMLASDLIEDIVGQSVSWDFYNWTIPAYTVAADNAIPLDLAKTIMEKVGAILYSEYDGSLSVRKKYKVPTNTYILVTPDQQYTDMYDNLSVSETYDIRSGYNKYRITDSDDAYSDRLEFIPDEDDNLIGDLRAYPSPWRLTIDIATTNNTLQLVGARSWVTRTEESEIIEFVEGSSSLRYPAETITDIIWHSLPLEGILHTQYTTDISASTSLNDGYGLAEITYTVKCLQASTAGIDDLNVQYVIEDTEV